MIARPRRRARPSGRAPRRGGLLSAGRSGTALRTEAIRRPRSSADQVDQPFERPDEVAQPPGPQGVAHQPDRGPLDKGTEQIVDDGDPPRQRQVGVGEGLPPSLVPVEEPCKPEELVLDLVHLGARPRAPGAHVRRSRGSAPARHARPPAPSPRARRIRAAGTRPRRARRGWPPNAAAPTTARRHHEARERAAVSGIDLPARRSPTIAHGAVVEFIGSTRTRRSFSDPVRARRTPRDRRPANRAGPPSSPTRRPLPGSRG